jgi:hypothetical protein
MHVIPNEHTSGPFEDGWSKRRFPLPGRWLESSILKPAEVRFVRADSLLEGQW